jgi:hypothetical protein
MHGKNVEGRAMALAPSPSGILLLPCCPDRCDTMRFSVALLAGMCAQYYIFFGGVIVLCAVVLVVRIFCFFDGVVMQRAVTHNQIKFIIKYKSFSPLSKNVSS